MQNHPCPTCGHATRSIDLIQGEGQVRVGVIPPISMRYGVHEDRRVVYCVAMPILLRMRASDSSMEE
jgi:hypothetical protein